MRKSPAIPLRARRASRVGDPLWTTPCPPQVHRLCSKRSRIPRKAFGPEETDLPPEPHYQPPPARPAQAGLGPCAFLPAVEKSPSERTLGPASQGHGGSYMLCCVCGGPSPSCRESVELLHGLQESERISGEPTPWPARRATLTRSSPAAWRWLRKGSCGRPGAAGAEPLCGLKQ